MISVQDGQNRILTRIPGSTSPEFLPLGKTLGRVVAEDVRVPLDVPPTDNSAVDGYAVGSADIPAAGTRDLRVPPGLLWWSSTTRAVRPTPLPKELVPKRLIRSGRLPSRVSGD